MTYRTASACLLCLVFVSPAFAASVLEFATREFGGPEPIVGTVQMSTEGVNTRLEIISVSSAEAGGLIFHGDRNEMIILDHLNSQFIVMDKNQIDTIAGQVGAAMTQIQESLAEMPAEQRALAQQMMQGQFPSKAPVRSPDTINALGSHGTVAGIRCQNYEVVRDGRKVREMCVSDGDDLEGGQETAQALRGVAEFFEEMRQAYSGAGGMDVFDRQQELFGHMSELNGYPIMYRDFDASGALVRESQLTAVRRKDLSPDFFDPPKGYTRQEMSQGTN